MKEVGIIISVIAPERFITSPDCFLTVHDTKDGYF